ncbi:MAG: Crp/Fnr family transcriptional regulator [Paludibacteraceae bacterium]|nr:Crp/Fnr family transcriptional regulator [Paludibacteraceae bacterium]
MLNTIKKDGLTRNSCTLNKAIADCFEKLTDEELLLLEENHVVLTYKKGENLCKQGTLASHIMYICNGLVKVFMENETSSLILKVLPAGNMLGLTALLDGSNVFRYSASAYQDCSVRLMDIGIFKKIILQNPAFANEVINILCENLIQTQTRFFSYTQKQSYGKLADTLICLSCNIFKAEGFELNLTRKELAELTGLTPESVIRILSKFKNDKLIHMEGKMIHILDMTKLKQISDYG